MLVLHDAAAAGPTARARRARRRARWRGRSGRVAAARVHASRHRDAGVLRRRAPRTLRSRRRTSAERAYWHARGGRAASARDADARARGAADPQLCGAEARVRAPGGGRRGAPRKASARDARAPTRARAALGHAESAGDGARGGGGGGATTRRRRRRCSRRSTPRSAAARAARARTQRSGRGARLRAGSMPPDGAPGRAPLRSGWRLGGSWRAATAAPRPRSPTPTPARRRGTRGGGRARAPRARAIAAGRSPAARGARRGAAVRARARRVRRAARDRVGRRDRRLRAVVALARARRGPAPRPARVVGRAGATSTRSSSCGARRRAARRARRPAVAAAAAAARAARRRPPPLVVVSNRFDGGARDAAGAGWRVAPCRSHCPCCGGRAARRGLPRAVRAPRYEAFGDDEVARETGSPRAAGTSLSRASSKGGSRRRGRVPPRAWPRRAARKRRRRRRLSGAAAAAARGGRARCRPRSRSRRTTRERASASSSTAPSHNEVQLRVMAGRLLRERAGRHVVPVGVLRSGVHFQDTTRREAAGAREQAAVDAARTSTNRSRGFSESENLLRYVAEPHRGPRPAANASLPRTTRARRRRLAERESTIRAEFPLLSGQPNRSARPAELHGGRVGRWGCRAVARARVAPGVHSSRRGESRQGLGRCACGAR